MAEFTENYLLKKPLDTDFYNIDDFNNNADIVDSELAQRLKIPQEFLQGNFAKFDAIGQVVDSGKKQEDFMPKTATYQDLGAEKQGEAKLVQNQLNIHKNNSDIHITQEEKDKLSKALTNESIVISTIKPPAIDGTVWIKIE